MIDIGVQLKQISQGLAFLHGADVAHCNLRGVSGTVEEASCFTTEHLTVA